MRTILSIALVAALAGCATQPAYRWGNYDEMLYQGYKDPNKLGVMRVSLEKHIVALEHSNQKVAPGLYADLGTLYFQTGESAKAVGFYAKERAAWPESRGLMDAMISNIEQRSKNPEAKS